MSHTTRRQRVPRNTWWKAICASDLTPQARLLAFTLSTFMNADGTRCYPGQETLARACGWTNPRSVRRALEELDRAGYLRIERFSGVRHPGRTQSTHRYWPTVPTGHDSPGETGDQPDTGDRLEPVDNPRPTGHESPPESRDQPDTEARPTGHLGQTNRTPVSANQARDQARPDHAPAREARTADPERNGHTTRGGEAHPLWQPVVGRLADANSKVHRAITQARPSDLGKLNAALDQAHAAGVRPLELRKLADLGTPLDDPSIKSVPATLAYRIRKHVEEHAHG